MIDKLENLISISKGKKHVVTNSPTENSKRILSIVDLRHDEKIVYTDDRKGTEVTTKDIMIAWDGANAGTIGYGKSGFIGSTISRLRFKEKNRVDTAYIGMFLKTQFNYLRKTATGATIPHISRSALESIKVPLPKYNDQVRIALILARIEKIVITRKNNLNELDKFLKSTFLEMFGSSNSEFDNWPIVEIKSLAAGHKGAMRTGPFGSNLLHSEFKESGYAAVIGIDNAVKNVFSWGERRYVTKEKYADLSNYKIFPGDVIITIMGTIGRSAVIPDDIPIAINTKHLAAITFNRKKVNPAFISYAIHSSPYIVAQFASKSRGAIMSGLNLGIIKETTINNPPIEMQDKFARIIDKVDSIKKVYVKSLTELENLYGVLSQKAFKGELDLSGIPLPEIKMERRTADELIGENKNELENSSSQLKIINDYPMSNSADRKNLLQTIFNEYIEDRKGIAFSLEDYWQHVWFKVSDYMDEFSIPLGLNDYDDIKQWLFDLIESGKIEQHFSEKDKQVLLKVKG